MTDGIYLRPLDTVRRRSDKRLTMSDKQYQQVMDVLMGRSPA